MKGTSNVDQNPIIVPKYRRPEWIPFFHKSLVIVSTDAEFKVRPVEALVSGEAVRRLKKAF
jgi:hypothetical protein